MSEDELAHAVGIDRALQDLEHGWMCKQCRERLQAMQKCLVCGREYEDETGAEGSGSGGKQWRATGPEALTLIQQAHLAGTI